MLAINVAFTQSGRAAFGDHEDHHTALDRQANLERRGFYGWMGFGGSIFQWHPQHKIGFAYVPTSLNTLDFVNARGMAYQSEVLRCVKRMANG